MRSFADTKKGADVQKNREDRSSTADLFWFFTFSFRKEKGLPAPAKKGSGLTDIAFEHQKARNQTCWSAPVAKGKVVELMVRKMKMMRTTNVFKKCDSLLSPTVISLPLLDISSHY